MKGDRVEIVVDTGSGTKTYEIVATKAGRRVDVVTARGQVEVSEVTRTGGSRSVGALPGCACGGCRRASGGLDVESGP
jgi:hypothetical protein